MTTHFSDFVPRWAARRAVEDAQREADQRRPTAAELDAMLRAEQAAIAADTAAAEAVVMRAGKRRRAEDAAEALVMRAAGRRAAADERQFELQRIRARRPRAGQAVSRGREMSDAELRELMAKAKRRGQTRLARALSDTLERRAGRDPGRLERIHTAASLTVTRG